MKFEKLKSLGPLLLIAAIVIGHAKAETSYGTGFFVSEDGYFVTNEHVVREAHDVRLRVGRDVHQASVIRTDPTNDLAILKCEGTFPHINVVSATAVSLGEPVFTIGFPNHDVQGSTPKFTKGDISARTGIQDDARFFQISVPVQPGNSGGPLVTESGNVVGVVSLRLDDINTLKNSGALPQNVNYAVKSDYLIGLMDSVKVKTATLQTASSMDRAAAIKAVEKAVGMVIAKHAATVTNHQVADSVQEDDNRKTVKQFLINHIASGNTNSEYRQIDFYAPSVDYFDNGVVDTDFIIADLERYHRRWNQLRKYEIQGDIFIAEISPKAFSAVCTLSFEVVGVPGRRTGLVTNHYSINVNQGQPRIRRVKSEAWKRGTTVRTEVGYSNLRATGTTKEANVISRIPSGTALLVLPSDDSWLAVITDQGLSGFMHETQIRF